MITENSPSYRDILPALTAWFPAEDHDQRALKGGGSWHYVRWQKIRQRLNQVCPGNWSISYGKPEYLGQLCHVVATVVICGVPQDGLGTAEIEILSSTGKNAARGNPIERAKADAFKEACEQHGIGAYLDDQTDEKKKAAFAQYMQRQGKPAIANAMQKQAIQEARSTGKGAKRVITSAQAKRLHAIAYGNGFTSAGLLHLIKGHGFDIPADITVDDYEKICDLARQSDKAQVYNTQTYT